MCLHIITVCYYAQQELQPHHDRWKFMITLGLYFLANRVTYNAHRRIHLFVYSNRSPVYVGTAHMIWQNEKRLGLSYLFQTGVVGIPSDDRNSQVVGQLQEILSSCSVSSVQFRIGQEQDGRHVAFQERFAYHVENC